MKIRKFWVSGCAVLMFLLVGIFLWRPADVPATQAAIKAQSSPTPEVMATWQSYEGGLGYHVYKPEGTGPFAAALTGLTWWDTTNNFQNCPGSGEFFDDGGTIQVKGWLNATPHIVEEKNCSILQNVPAANVLRDGQMLYFFADKQLQRKAISGGPGDPATPLNNAPPLTLLNETAPASAVVAMDHRDRLLWADRIFVDPTPFTQGDETQRNDFYRMPADDSAPAEMLFGHNNVGAVVRLEAVRYSFNGINVDGFVWLTEYGELYRYQPHPEPSEQVIKLAEYVADFAVHTVEFKTGQRDAKIFAAIHRPPSTEFFPHGALLEFEPASGDGITLWPDTTDTINSEGHVVSVATDSDGLTPVPKNIYISTIFYDCDADSCSQQPGMRIYRRPLFTEGGPDLCSNHFCPILELGDGGDQLASDDRWLYFARDLNIYRYPTDAPPIEVDIAATHLEVNQAIQNLNHDFPLVAGHRTVVRGYASVPVDSTGSAGFQVTARLNGKLNGKPLPGSPLSPVKDIVVDGTSDLATQREDKEKTFLFELPESWVKNQAGGFEGVFIPSTLELEMVVNPNAAVAEAGGLGFLNNDVSVSLEVYQRETTCLASIPMLTEAPVPDAIPYNLPSALEYAQKFLPVSDIKVHAFHYTWLHDDFEEYIFVLSDDGDPFYFYDDGDWGDGGGRDALETLAWLSSWPCPGNTHWLGVVHSDTPWGPYGGFGRTPGHVLMSKIGKGGTIAHELGHNFGRQHTKCGNLPAKEENFDSPGLGNGVPMGVPIQYNPCNLGPTDLSDPATYVGFDSLELAVRAPADYADLMSYADDKWPSMLGWYWMYHNNRLWPLPPFTMAAAPFAGADEVLLVQGAIDTDGRAGGLRRTQRLSMTAAPAERIAESAEQAASRAGSPYEIHLVDADGVTLQATAAITIETSGHSNLVEPFTFVQYVPFAPQTERVQLVSGGQVLAERTISAHAPQVTLTDFTLDMQEERIELTWEATDADGDALSSTVLYSSDDGATWRALGTGFRGTHTRLGTHNLPAGDRSRLRVLVSDGFNTGMATSEPFAIDLHPPVPYIDGLFDGQRLEYGEIHGVFGLAMDPDEGSLDDEQLLWTVSGPVSSTVTGNHITLYELVPGDYTLTLLATDSDGLTGEASVPFEVLPLVVPDADVPGLDGLCVESAYSNGARIPLPRGPRTIDEGRWPDARLVHANGALYVCINDLGFSTSAEGRLAGIQIDADASGGSATAGDIGLFVDEDGIAFQTMAFFDVMVTNPLPEPGFETAIYPSAVGWSVEMRIDDALVGGWNHPARLMLKHEGTDMFNDALNWPPIAEHSQPGTWAAAYFGTPPAPRNQPPVADTGTNVQITVSEPITLHLDGGLSYDPDHDRLTYRWRQTGGPPVTLENPNERLVPFAVAPVRAVTDLHFELIVNDGQVDSAPDAFTFRLNPPDDPPDDDPTGPQGDKIHLPLIRR